MAFLFKENPSYFASASVTKTTFIFEISVKYHTPYISVTFYTCQQILFSCLEKCKLVLKQSDRYYHIYYAAFRKKKSIWNIITCFFRCWFPMLLQCKMYHDGCIKYMIIQLQQKKCQLQYWWSRRISLENRQIID